jgi:hypothetical protein
MLGLLEYEAGVHDGCGLHRSIADTDPNFALDDRVCPVCAQAEAYLRERADQELEDEKDLEPSAPRKSDGRSTFIRLEEPLQGAS